MSTYFNGSNSSTYSSYYGTDGSVTIGVGVEILGGLFGIEITGEGTIFNLGIVEAGRSRYPIGIELGSGTITNGSANSNAGEIIGGRGIEIEDSGIVNNFGTIAGTYVGGPGGHFRGSFNVYNTGGVGIYSPGGITIYNSGTIEGGTDRYTPGVGICFGYSNESAKDAELIVNDRNAVILGARAIYGGIETAGTVINYGTIESDGVYTNEGDGIHEFALYSTSDLLVVEPGSKIIGDVFDSGTIELAAGSGPGTVTGDYNAAIFLVQYGANWTIYADDVLPGEIFTDAGTLTTANGLEVRGSLDITGTIIANAGRFDSGIDVSYAGVVTNDGLLDITQGGYLDIFSGTLTGDGTIEISDQASVELYDAQVTGALVDFADATGTLTLSNTQADPLADPLGLGIRIEGFSQGDVIDLRGISDTSTASLSYGGGVLTVFDDGTAAAELSLTNVPARTIFGLQGDDHGGTELVIWSVPNVLPTTKLYVLEDGITALGRDVAETQGVTDQSLNVFTPQGLLYPSGGPIKGDINIADGRPEASGQTITLAPDVQGIVMRGQYRAVEIIGHAANAYAASELLVGNNGNDTIIGGGGSGTIISGTGQNQIETGTGNDTVYARGVDCWVTAQGSATVHAGGGLTTFADSGTAASADKVMGGTGTAVMNSGLGQDTFVGGSGTSFMNDTGPGRMALVVNNGVGGTDIVTGFDPSNGDYIRTTAISHGWSDFQNNIWVVGGSSFVNLADGTKIEFVGFTSLSAADFHG